MLLLAKSGKLGRTELDDAEIREALLAIASYRDREAFAGLFRYFAPRLKAYGMKSGMAPQAAEEMTQESMINVWRKASLYDPRKASGATWIFSIARNKRIDLFRRERRPDVEAFAAEPAENAAPAADIAYDMVENQHSIAAALKQLPVEQAAVLKKAFFEDKSHSAISEELSLPLGTVKSRSRMGLARMRVLLAEIES